MGDTVLSLRACVETGTKLACGAGHGMARPDPRIRLTSPICSGIGSGRRWPQPRTAERAGCASIRFARSGTPSSTTPAPVPRGGSCHMASRPGAWSGSTAAGGGRTELWSASTMRSVRKSAMRRAESPRRVPSRWTASRSRRRKRGEGLRRRKEGRMAHSPYRGRQPWPDPRPASASGERAGPRWRQGGARPARLEPLPPAQDRLGGRSLPGSPGRLGRRCARALAPARA